MEPKISLIVPIYNIDRYLGTCIESILKQTYTNLEVILVDDGSQDRCGDICDLYARKDSRIRVIHKPNGGLVSARKAGLAAAAGVYAGYVDGDDWIAPRFVEGLYRAISSENGDIAIAGQSCDLFSVSSHILSNIPAGTYSGEKLDWLKSNMLSYGEFFRFGITTYVWNKLFRRDMLIQYQDGVDHAITIGEDAAVVYPYLMDCTKVCVIDACEYHYRQREDSMLKRSNSFRNEAIGLRLLYDHLMQMARQYPEKYRLKEQITDYLLGMCIMRSGGVLRELQKEHFPYNGDFYGKKIVVWSAGTFGQQLMNRIKESHFCQVVGWVDVDYWEYRRCCLDVDSLEDAEHMDFDYILIATVSGTMARKVKDNFVNRGIPENKILQVNCPEHMRAQLLKKYLDM